MDNQEDNQINNTQPNIPGTPENHPMGVPTNGSVNPLAANPVQDPPASSQPLENTNPAPSAPSDPTPAVSDPTQPKSNSKLLFFIIGAVLVLVIILVVIMFSGTLNKSNTPAVPTPQAQQIVTPTPSEQSQEIPQNPIANQQDANNALGELDQVNPDTAGAELSQNDQDATTFSQ